MEYVDSSHVATGYRAVRNTCFWAMQQLKDVPNDIQSLHDLADAACYLSGLTVPRDHLLLVHANLSKLHYLITISLQQSDPAVVDKIGNEVISTMSTLIDMVPATYATSQ